MTTSADLIRDILIGAAGDGTGGLLAGLLAAAAGRVARRFRPTPQQDALHAALTAALDAALDALPDDGDRDAQYDCIRTFLEQEIVQEELTPLLDPQDALDVPELRTAFDAVATKYPADRLGSLTFDGFISPLVRGYLARVRRLPALEGVLAVDRLETLIRQTHELLEVSAEIRAAVLRSADAGERSADSLDDIRESIADLTRIARGVAEAFWAERPAPDGAGADPAALTAATTRYLAWLLERYRHLELKGMGFTDRVALALRLEDLYVPLRAHRRLPDGETWARELRVAGRPLSDDELATTGERVGEPQPVLALLREAPGLIVLGDPGAGKTTLLKYLALRLARGRSDELGLGRRLPILLPLSAYAAALAKGDVPLDQFLEVYYRGQAIDLPLGRMFAQALARGEALVLLDGLDEVQALGDRHTVIDRIQTFFAFHHPAGNKFLITSRIVGYAEVRPSAAALVECTLVDFDDEDIQTFVARWTETVEVAARGGRTDQALAAARVERDALLQTVAGDGGVRRLATNPLLLTILAMMKRQGVALPERRVELYDHYIRTLVRHWNLARGLERRRKRALDVVETVRVLGALALWLQETSPGRGLVGEHALRGRLAGIYADRGHAEPEQAARDFLRDVRDYAGLLVARGRRQFGFVHLTFQEYLAAVGIAQLGQSDLQPVVDQFAAHLDDDAWREVFLLTVGQIGILQGRDAAAGQVLRRLIAQSGPRRGAAAALAGEAVLDVWPGGVTRDDRAAVVQALVAVVGDDGVPAATRVRAGVALGRLGDPRLGVADSWVHTRPDGTACELPDLHLCYVPGGPFWMAEGEDENGKEIGRVHHYLDRGYWIGKYPVTNAQFDLFVHAGGYHEARYWVEASRHGAWREDGMVKGWLDSEWRDRPAQFRDPFGLPNHPVVGVMWYEALAFCRWLNAQLAPPAPWRFGLPSEAEWEKAARGGLELPDTHLVMRVQQALSDMEPSIKLEANPHERRNHPWDESRLANRLDDEIANFGKSVNSTSPVGAYPGNRSRYGALDMIGNVWEWTRSIDGKLPYDPADGREDNRQVERYSWMRLRGGGWWNDAKSQRCGARGGYDPGGRYSDLYGFRIVLSPFLPLVSDASEL